MSDLWKIKAALVCFLIALVLSSFVGCSLEPEDKTWTGRLYDVRTLAIDADVDSLSYIEPLNLWLTKFRTTPHPANPEDLGPVIAFSQIKPDLFDVHYVEDWTTWPWYKVANRNGRLCAYYWEEPLPCKCHGSETYGEPYYSAILHDYGNDETGTWVEVSITW